MSPGKLPPKNRLPRAHELKDAVVPLPPWGLDAAQYMVLAQLTIAGAARKLLLSEALLVGRPALTGPASVRASMPASAAARTSRRTGSTTRTRSVAFTLAGLVRRIAAASYPGRGATNVTAAPGAQRRLDFQRE